MEKLRRKIRAYVKLPVIITGPLTEHPIHVSNISLSGCFLVTDADLHAGDSFSFYLGLPRGRDLRLSGTVIRRQEDPRGYGINFGELTEDERADLARLIADSEEPPEHG